MHKLLALFLLCLAAIPAIGALSPELKEWGAGPAQWLMTPDEQRAWRKVATDAEAVKFIDLFWARRDPTPGNATNQFRAEFEARVSYADLSFGEKRKRGAMTDRGRVYVTMGPPTTMDGVLNQAGMSADSSDTTGARQSSIRHIWLWEDADARKYDMSRITVVFVEDPITHRVQRDPLRADFSRAGPAAITKTIKSPELNAVPEWAMTGGLQPMAPMIAVAEERVVPMPAVAAEPAPSQSAPAGSSNTPGVSRLTLLPGGATWNAQYCSSKAATPKLKFMLLITGPLDGKSTDQRTREKEVKPERMPALPGCYALGGTVPVSNLAAGRYKLTVMLDDVETGDTYTVKQEFRVE